MSEDKVDPLKLVACDFETYYDAEYSLSKMSVHNYLNDPRFDAYLVAIKSNTGLSYVGHPSKFDWSLLNGMIPCAHNASFDLAVFLRLLELGRVNAMQTQPWCCTADLSAYLGSKRDLVSAMRHLMGEEISKATRTAMLGRTGAELSVDPEVLAYGGRDADNCLRLATKWIDKWPAKEREISRLNREACMRGIGLDVGLVDSALNTLKPKLAEELAKIPWVAEGKPPLSPYALRAHGEKVGIPVPASLAKDSEDFLAWAEQYSELYPWVRAVGTYRSINTLLCRVQSLKDGVTKEGIFPFGIKYFGAATGRFSGGGGEGGGKFNLQNMPRAAMYGVDLRPMFIARPGHVFIQADYHQVEARCLLWRAGDEATLDLIRQGRSVYQAYAEMNGLSVPGEDLKKANPKKYSFAKACCLGLGYGAGGPKFRVFSKVTAGLDLTEEEAVEAVASFREKNWRIVRFWRAHQEALAYSARRKDPTHEIELASGRVLTYWDPRIVNREIEVTQTRGEYRTRFYGGKCTENEIQATCRDILVEAWLAVAAAGYQVVLSVHDELVIEVPEDGVAEDVKRIRQLMCNCSPWAAGLPLGVDINVTKCYMK